MVLEPGLMGIILVAILTDYGIERSLSRGVSVPAVSNKRQTIGKGVSQWSCAKVDMDFAEKPGNLLHPRHFSPPEIGLGTFGSAILYSVALFSSAPKQHPTCSHLLCNCEMGGK